MNVRQSKMWIGAVLATVSATAMLAAAPPPFEINRFTIDGGGDMLSVGGGFELSGTIGQSDAGVLEGSGFTLAGGFWFEEPPCDCNSTGSVNLFDYTDLEACVSGPKGGLVNPSCVCFDLDSDQDVDLLDMGRFQQLFDAS